MVAQFMHFFFFEPETFANTMYNLRRDKTKFTLSKKNMNLIEASENVGDFYFSKSFCNNLSMVGWFSDDRSVG